jgi:hypothetical protein
MGVTARSTRDSTLVAAGPRPESSDASPNLPAHTPCVRHEDSITGHLNLGGASKSFVRWFVGARGVRVRALSSALLSAADTQDEDGQCVVLRNVTNRTMILVLPHHPTTACLSTTVQATASSSRCCFCGVRRASKGAFMVRWESAVRNPSLHSQTVHSEHGTTHHQQAKMRDVYSVNYSVTSSRAGTRFTVAAYVSCCSTQGYARGYVVQYYRQ